MSKTCNRPLRILQVYGSLNRGGAETWLMDVMRNTSREELQIDACLTRGSKGAYQNEFESLGGRVHCSPFGKNVWSFCRQFKRLLDAEHYDVVHSHLYYFSGLVLRLAAHAGVPKRIAHIHPAEDLKAEEPFRGFYVWLMRRWIRHYGTNFVGPTEASLDGFWGPGWQKDPTKHVIYNGIHTARFVRPFDRFKVRCELDIPESAPIVLNVSRFSPHKRHEFLVQVAERVLGQKQDVCFLLIGAGKLKEAIEEQVRLKGLESNFRFISGAPNIDRYLMAADLFAFPSCNEGFGIALIEAAAAGLRVIAQDIPGVREAAMACIEPTLLPLETTVDEWSQIILETLKQPRITENQRQKLIRNFPYTIEKSIGKLKDIYYD
ncbi:MAG: glycosyltransferase [Planctomycetota bacterium]